MKRIDYYIFAVTALNVFLFILFTNTALTAALGTVIEHQSVSGYAVMVLFALGTIITLDSLSQLVKLLIDEKFTERSMADLKPVLMQTLILLATYAFIKLFDAYLMYDLYGAY